jgi:glycosyltransferase involved in cell wall biosynthesis
MNIVHVVESLAVGGLERVVLSLASWQRRRGDVARIICLFHEGALAAEARALGIEVLALDKTRGLDVRALRALRATLRGARADVLHTHNAVAHYYAAAAAIGLGIACVINTRHGMGTVQSARRLDRLYRTALLGTDVAASVCRAGQERFVQTGVIPLAKAVVVPNGVVMDGIEARTPAAKATLLARLGRPGNALLLGTVGRLSPVKDHATLLLAVQQLRASGRAVELVVVGDGETRSALESQARSLKIDDSVHFLGMRSDVAQLLPAFDVFVLSSTSEGYSLALVEAAAAALPIVATQVGGNADIVVEGRNGRLVPARSADALATALADLADDSALRERMGAAGRQWALRHGTVDAMGQAYLALYEDPTPAALRRRAAAPPGAGA